MNLKLWLAAGAVLTAVGIAGCSTGATISPISIGQSDPFCTDVGAFQAQTVTLEAANASGDLATLQRASSATTDALKKLQQDAAKVQDKVNGHLLRDDLATAVTTYQALTAQLAAASPTDPNAVAKALANIQGTEGQAFTQATGRLDSYAKQVCKVSVSSATTTSTTPPTTAPTSTVPSTTSTSAAPGATTTVVGPVGPTSAPTSGPPTTTTGP